MIAIAALAASAQKPCVFITESAAPQVSGDATVGDVKGSLAFTGGTSPQNIEVMKAFVRYCPALIVTADRAKADYVVRLDHDPISPTTPFTHGNKVAVFNKNEDLIYTNSTRILRSAAKDACAAITGGDPVHYVVYMEEIELADGQKVSIDKVERGTYYPKGSKDLFQEINYQTGKAQNPPRLREKSSITLHLKSKKQMQAKGDADQIKSALERTGIDVDIKE